MEIQEYKSSGDVMGWESYFVQGDPEYVKQHLFELSLNCHYLMGRGRPDVTRITHNGDRSVFRLDMETYDYSRGAIFDLGDEFEKELQGIEDDANVRRVSSMPEYLYDDDDMDEYSGKPMLQAIAEDRNKIYFEVVPDVYAEIV